MATIFDASAEFKYLPADIAQQFSFTEAESELCLGLLQGKTLDELAYERRQTRTQLRDCYDSLLKKTGANNEAKLITIVLSNTSYQSMDDSKKH